MKNFTSLLGISFAQLLVGMAAFAQGQSGGVANAIRATPSDSPFNSYTASAVTYMLIAGVLVTVLLVGAFLVLNLGMMSKREEDKIGQRDPSDVGILKSTNWPAEAEEPRMLPAEENDFELRSEQPPHEKGERKIPHDSDQNAA